MGLGCTMDSRYDLEMCCTHWRLTHSRMDCWGGRTMQVGFRGVLMFRGYVTLWA